MILSQRQLQTSIEDAHRRKMKRTVQKATDLWAKREALKRFWIYRGMMMPAKREIHRRKLLLAKLQACIRGGLLRGQIRTQGKPQVPANPLVRKVMMNVRFFLAILRRELRRSCATSSRSAFFFPLARTCRTNARRVAAVLYPRASR